MPDRLTTICTTLLAETTTPPDVRALATAYLALQEDRERLWATVEASQEDAHA